MNQNVQNIEYSKEIKEILRCPLCFMCLFEPVSLSCCGHSFCKECMLRIYDRSNQSIPLCPLCRETLPFQSDLVVNHVLKELINKIIPHEKQIKRNGLESITIQLTDQIEEKNKTQIIEAYIRCPITGTIIKSHKSLLDKDSKIYNDREIINPISRPFIDTYLHFQNLDISDKNKNDKKSLPIIPLFGLSCIVFPGSPLQLHVFEPRYRLMIRRCLRGTKRFGVANVSGIMNGENIGTMCHIDQSFLFDDGRLLILTHGEKRFKIIPESLHTQDEYYCAQISWMEDDPLDNSSLRQCHSISLFLQETISNFLDSYSISQPRIREVVKNKFGIMPDASNLQAMSYWCSSFLIGQMSREVAIQLLNTTSILDRLKMLEQIANDCFKKEDSPESFNLKNQMAIHAQRG